MELLEDVRMAEFVLRIVKALLIYQGMELANTVHNRRLLS